ncbi:hypothetical protein [Skermania piniformis]|uniref:DUF7711 domain-containing protein n=1 Tax=Skermania pinensis TaxID=39122 RepID=A0ABX8S844_9ACTN|nr:hypothetical protein [Skermania piniformis]QXQ14028.1 hypothetical protein KV203_00725 [Skermania piniformis]
MKRSTAVRNLAEVASTATSSARLRDADIGWPLRELWVSGQLLESADILEWGSVILVLDLPAAGLPWLVQPPALDWVRERLRLGKRPLEWCYRPREWPAWNPRHRRVARFWTERDGVDDTALDALHRGEVDQLDVQAPTDDEFRTQLTEELGCSWDHLRAVLDSYWEQDWRRAQHSLETSPEEQLWRGAEAVSQIREALDRLS